MGNNATLIGSPTFVAGSVGFGLALSFDGTSQYATAPDPGFVSGDSWTAEGSFATTSPAPMLIVGLVKPGGSAANWYVLISNGIVSGVIAGNSFSGGSTTYNDGQKHIFSLVVLNGTRGYFFLDGVLIATLPNNFSYSPATGQTLYLGSYAGQGGFFAGTLDEFRFSNTGRYAYTYTPPTAPFALDGTTAALYHFDGNGNDSTGARMGTPTVFDGNSITWGAYGSGPSLTTGTNYPATAAARLGTGYYPYNFGVPGQTIQQASVDAARQVDVLYITGGLLFFEGGINNIIAGDNAATITGYLQAYLQARRAMGWEMCVATIHRCGNVTGFFPAGYENIETAVNTWIRSNAATLGYTVVDVAANDLLNDPANTTYRNADQIHFTDAGYQLYGQTATPPPVSRPVIGSSAPLRSLRRFRLRATGLLRK